MPYPYLHVRFGVYAGGDGSPYPLSGVPFYPRPNVRHARRHCWLLILICTCKRTSCTSCFLCLTRFRQTFIINIQNNIFIYIYRQAFLLLNFYFRSKTFLLDKRRKESCYLRDICYQQQYDNTNQKHRHDRLQRFHKTRIRNLVRHQQADANRRSN